MPSPSQPSHNTDRPTYPDYKDQFGEDPARILYTEMDPRPRIRAIESKGLCRAWLDVETDRSDPRKWVVAALNRRLSVLQG